MKKTGKILIVDDDKDVLRFLTRFLSEEGYTVLSALNGKIALSMLKKSKFDLIMLDVKMPVMDGMEFMEKIENINLNSMIIVMTGEQNHKKDLSLAKHKKVVDIIYKPYNINKLRKLIKKAYFEYGKLKKD